MRGNGRLALAREAQRSFGPPGGLRSGLKTRRLDWMRNHVAPEVLCNIAGTAATLPSIASEPPLGQGVVFQRQLPSLLFSWFPYLTS